MVQETQKLLLFQSISDKQMQTYPPETVKKYILDLVIMVDHNLF